MARDPAQVQFDTLAVEGALFTAEWLGKVASFAAPAQADSDYRVRAGFTLREEIALAWRSAQALWAQFDKARRLADQDPAAVTRRFVTELLQQVLGFPLRHAGQPVEADGRVFPISHFAFGDTVPVVSGMHTLALDAADARFGDPAGTRRRSAFGLLQEYLNAQNTTLWGIASNGLVLRLARDNASLTRPAWVEADLERLFSEERFAEFGVLWLLLHATRFGGETVAPSESVLERWRDACRDQGVRARDTLRDGVEQALLTLGNGFLSHPGNAPLREALANNRIGTREFFQQLLRLVYRQIFLLTIEERGILHPEPSDAAARELYAEGYSLRRLRDRAVRRNAHDRHHDLWEGLKLAWKGLSAGEPHLALPALSGLFAPDQCRDLDAARLENRHLLLALFHLAWLRDNHQPNAPLTRVNWRDMGPEELGSIYESLLELVPQVGDGNRRFAFLQGAETRGNARKTTGSYYTPDSLVQLLLDSALEPVIAGKLAGHPSGQAAIDALLSITVVDPACGSGHFLLAAARRIATHLARVMAESSGSGQPTPSDYRHALRQVVGRCIFGVDLNPMAVELCKVSLWLEALEPGLPLTFLDSHIQRGNALLGTTPALMAGGVPDDAWSPIEGDDRKIASALKKRNRRAAGGQRSMETMWTGSIQQEAQTVTQAVAALDAASDASPEALATKASQWDGILGSAEYRHQKLVADAWCAAFVWPKHAGALSDVAPTDDLWRQLRDGQGQPPALLVKTVTDLAAQYGLFHWHLQFPQVFVKGGFDVVLGNPPWERVKLQEQEFFASRSEEIANAPNAAARKRLIAKLPEVNPQLATEWSAASREAEGESRFIRDSGRYPLCGKGDINTYAIFAEHNRRIVAPLGRAGFIVPSGIATDDTTKDYFSSLATTGHLVSLYDFRNHDRLFYDVGHRRFKFCLLTISGEEVRASTASLVFFAESSEHVSDPSRMFTLTPNDIALFNPNTQTCPTFRSRRDAETNLSLYEVAGIFWREADEKNGNPWGLRFLAMFHMSGDSGAFKSQQQLLSSGGVLAGSSFLLGSSRHLPLVEAKMVHQFDHRFGDYADKPSGSLDTQLPDVPWERLADASYQPLARYWVPEDEVRDRLQGRWSRDWLLGWRDICRSTDERTLIASVIPRAAVGDKFLLMLPSSEPSLVACLYACLCSFVVDYAARQKVGGTSLKYFTMRQFPVLKPEKYLEATPWQPAVSLREFIVPRVLELTYTSWDLKPFGQDVGHDGPPFRWNPERRFLLRCELDAAFFHIYGRSREDAEYVMDTFPIVRRNDERAHGSFRTKQVILDIYDQMAEAVRTGNVYATRLDPPPADSTVAHGPRAPEVPTAPGVAPTMLPAEEAAILILALVHANGGSIRRSELARAFALRSMPSVLLKLAPVPLNDKAKQWAAKRSAQTLPDGQMTAALGALSSRSGVALGTDAASRAVVNTSATTPAETKIDEWFRFEARLLLNVLRSQPDEALKTIDTGLKGNDRTLLDEAA